MKYWADMQTKVGFQKGEATPAEAEACRFVYVATMNKLLATHASAFRVVAWDRGGVHNSILILTVPADLLNADELTAWNAHLFCSLTMQPEEAGVLGDRIQGHKWGEEPKLDDGWMAAWQEACDLDPDAYVEVTALIDPEFEEWLNAAPGTRK